jgi:hypothetical protein
MPDLVLKTLLVKAQAFLGPYFGIALVSFGIAWALRGKVADADVLRAAVARLDSTTVKKDTFALFVQEMRIVAAKQDSTNALLRRWICRGAPRLCP